MNKINNGDITCKSIFFKGFGLTEQYYAIANKLLVEHGLTTDKKENIHNSKLDIAKKIILDKFIVLCSHCHNEKSSYKSAIYSKNQIVILSNQDCYSCGGSLCKHLSNITINQLKKKNIEKISIIGGFPKQINHIKNQLKTHIKLSLVDGTKRLSKKLSTPIVENSDLIIIWCQTPIGHSSTNIFKHLKNIIYVNSSSTVGFWSSLIDEIR